MIGGKVLEVAALVALSWHFRAGSKYGDHDPLCCRCTQGGHAVGLPPPAVLTAELLPKRQQAFFWIEVGRTLCAGKKTRHKGVHVLLHAEQLAPQRIHHDLVVRETVAGLLRQARRETGGRELRGLAWRMGIAPLG